MTYTPERLRTIDIEIAKRLGWSVGIDDDQYWMLYDAEGEEYGSILTPFGNEVKGTSWTHDEVFDFAISDYRELRFTTDANAALTLMQPGWGLILWRDKWEIEIVASEDAWDMATIARLSRADTPALAVAKARFPELFEEVQ